METSSVLLNQDSDSKQNSIVAIQSKRENPFQVASVVFGTNAILKKFEIVRNGKKMDHNKSNEEFSNTMTFSLERIRE